MQRARLNLASAVEAVNEAFEAPSDWSLGGDGDRCTAWAPRQGGGGGRAQWPWHRACGACGQSADRHQLRCGECDDAAADEFTATADAAEESPAAALQLLARLVRCARLCGCSTALVAPVWTRDALAAPASSIEKLRIRRGGACFFSLERMTEYLTNIYCYYVYFFLLSGAPRWGFLSSAAIVASLEQAIELAAAPLHPRARVELACALDSIYFELHYADLVDATAFERCVARWNIFSRVV